jgi:hypothetical protein
MTLIGTHEIPCLDDNDYAAYALQMQCVANRIEDELVANRNAALSVLQRPVRVWRCTQLNTEGSASSFSPDAINYSYHYPASFGIAFATLNLRGWWRIGGLWRCTSSAPVVGNNRIFSLATFPANTSVRSQTSNNWVARAQDITWETNTTGGESLYVQYDVFNPGDPEQPIGAASMRTEMALSVENSGSETVTFTGTLWCVYLGDTPSISIT